MLLTLLSFVAASTSLVNARLSITNPLVDQLPPVARTGSLFEWTPAQDTFSETKDVSYAAPTLPGWLSFDSSSRTFHGTPALEDQGFQDVAITASDLNSSKTSKAKLLVTSAPPPVLQRPISSQFTASNPSLSSVYFLHHSSALSSPNPVLRIPPRWSFSIGFEGSTFKAADDLFYNGLQADGSPLPSWINFSSDDITFHGVTPELPKGTPPMVLSLALHASDFKGYSAAALPFEVVIASHELSISAPCLPTINVTGGSAFNLSLTSPADFQGVLLDDSALQPEDLSELALDVSKYSDWLAYDESTKTLSGLPSQDLVIQATSLAIPVILASIDKQIIHTIVSLAIVPSFFVSGSLDPITVGLGQDVHFNLTSYFTDQTALSGNAGDVQLTTGYEPVWMGKFLNFDPKSAIVSGFIPGDIEESQVLITFTAYSHITHSTSHTLLPMNIVSTASGDSKDTHPRTLSPKRKIILGLQIVCGVAGGLLLLGIILAALRRYASVEDTALTGEEGRRAWSSDEKKYYGLNPSSRDASLSPLPMALPANTDPVSVEEHENLSSGAGILSKAEFFSKLRTTVRQVSDMYHPRQAPNRPAIGWPIPLQHKQIFPDPTGGENIIGDIDLGSYTASLEERSSAHLRTEVAAQRRADFAPPQMPAPTASDIRDRRTPSIASTGSVVSSTETASSMNIHETEAVVQTASRARSVMSEKSVSGLSYASLPSPPSTGRPRLVPFTSSSRVPRLSVLSSPCPINAGDNAAWAASRVTSQRATLMSTDVRVSQDWSLGVHYVRALGEDRARSDQSSASSTFDAALSVTNARQSRYSSGSFSLASSKYTARDVAGMVPRILTRTGEQFKFCIPAVGSDAATLTVRLLSGNPLPDFMRANTASGSVAEVRGTPRKGDVGEVRLGVFDAATGECLGKAVLEIVARV